MRVTFGYQGGPGAVDDTVESRLGAVTGGVLAESLSNISMSIRSIYTRNIKAHIWQLSRLQERCHQERNERYLESLVLTISHYSPMALKSACWLKALEPSSRIHDDSKPNWSLSLFMYVPSTGLASADVELQPQRSGHCPT
jgi:hypothetical protein